MTANSNAAPREEEAPVVALVAGCTKGTPSVTPPLLALPEGSARHSLPCHLSTQVWPAPPPAPCLYSRSPGPSATTFGWSNADHSIVKGSLPTCNDAADSHAWCHNSVRAREQSEHAHHCARFFRQMRWQATLISANCDKRSGVTTQASTQSRYICLGVRYKHTHSITRLQRLCQSGLRRSVNGFRF